ncbi:TIGR01777 family oxidoreductase [Streptomyces gobiensis]|uniref:TIGR01777 family oxidoreductase n=1 Tax=Streptomyces gobiensis TaxID=2875706 RepID=UPI001E5BAF93|nr:TIGR01777 family oxidoreductase [Streptomyces gobiensis]UGY95006.1 TIGR01777 family oxidoreductase [Streptomyces gobiensis]
MGRMRIAITGSTGLIGSALVRSLHADGHEVVRLVRRPAKTGDEVQWDPKGGYVDTAGLAGCEAVVHLAGAGVGDKRWTAAYKREIRDSRVLGTTTIAEAIASLDTPPHTLVSASGINYYGDTGNRAVDESDPPGSGFLAEVCQEWEAATAPAERAGVRTVHARSGLAVAQQGGAWGRLFPVFKAGLGGRMGNGRQYWSFIALHDHVAALRFVLDNATVSGPVNLTAPDPVTNREVTAAMGRVLRRPTFAAVPAPVLRLAVGEFADDVLGSFRVIPVKLLESGFTFAFPRIDDAIRAALR